MIAPSDREILDRLSPGASIADREPYSYATSAPLELLQVADAAGARSSLILKDVTRGRLIGNAAESKPEAVYEPAREIETYRGILADRGIGPRLLASRNDGPTKQWLLVERAAGVELWQIGELDVWDAVAGWLGRFHERFAAEAGQIASSNPHLINFGLDWFLLWAERARAALVGSPDRRAVRVGAALGHYESVAEHLAVMPRTFVHGEFYPSNVIVDPVADPVTVSPVDWEMSGVGSGLVDLAALSAGWDRPERLRLLAAWRGGVEEEGGNLPAGDRLERDLDHCRLHMALQWIGWSKSWTPPSEHANDWLGEALSLIEELGLG